MHEKFNKILYYKTSRESLTVLCSVMKHAGSRQSTQEVGRNMRCYHMFLPTLLPCSSGFLRALQQNRAQSRLLYLLNAPVLWFLFQIIPLIWRILEGGVGRSDAILSLSPFLTFHSLPTPTPLELHSSHVSLYSERSVQNYLPIFFTQLISQDP